MAEADWIQRIEDSGYEVECWELCMGEVAQLLCVPEQSHSVSDFVLVSDIRLLNRTRANTLSCQSVYFANAHDAIRKYRISRSYF